MNFFKAVLHPDQEELEFAERHQVCQAANALQVGEFQFLQLAYEEWHGHAMPEALVARLFSTYMLDNDVPHWARHYARVILLRVEQDRLDDNDPRYHRYDHDYVTHVPRGFQRFCYAAGILAFLMASGVLVASMTVDDLRSQAAHVRQAEVAEPDARVPGTDAERAFRSFNYPPYVPEGEIDARYRHFGWGRADSPNGDGVP